MKYLRTELFKSLLLLGALFWSKIGFAKFRKFKKVTEMDSFPMPLGADVLDSLAGTSIFSTLGVKNGY